MTNTPPDDVDLFNLPQDSFGKTQFTDLEVGQVILWRHQRRARAGRIISIGNRVAELEGGSKVTWQMCQHEDATLEILMDAPTSYVKVRRADYDHGRDILDKEMNANTTEIYEALRALIDHAEWVVLRDAPAPPVTVPAEALDTLRRWHAGNGTDSGGPIGGKLWAQIVGQFLHAIDNADTGQCDEGRNPPGYAGSPKDGTR